MNPNTYEWTQADAEEYDSNAPPEEQAEYAAARKRYAARLIAGMRQAVASVPSYCERKLVDCICEACGGAFEASTGYYEPDEYAYCAECCHW